MKFIKIFLLFLLFSCQFGPKYQRPEFNFLDKENADSLKQDMYWWNNVEDENLKNLIEISLKENLNIKEHKAKIEKYLARLGIAKDMLIPDVELNATSARKKVSTQGFYGLNPFIVRNYRQDNITANFDWKLDLFGSVKKQIEAANALLTAEHQRLYDIENATAVQVAREYILLTSLKQQLEIVKEEVKNQERHVNLSSDRFESGIVDKTEINENKIFLSDAKIQIPTLEFQIEEACLRLDILLAKKPGEVKEILGDKKLKIPEFNKISKKTLSSELIKNNPHILITEQELIAANANIGAAISEYFPKFSFSGNYGLEAINDKNLFSKKAETMSIGPLISWRIFDFLKINDEIKEAKSQKKEYLEAYKKAVLETIGEVEIATIKIKKTTKISKLNENKLLLQKENLNLLIDQYKSGLTNYINVINAKDNLYKVEIELIKSHEKTATSIIDFVDAVY